MKNKKIIILSIVGILVIIAGVSGAFLLTANKKNKDNKKPDTQVTDNKIIQDVNPDKAESMYEELTEKCTGALVWNLKPGDEVAIDNLDNSTACKTNDHYSKMIGYTYDKDKNVVIHVNLLKKVNNNLYKLDDTFVGEFKEETLNDLLDLGTTYKYLYTKNGKNYKLSKVELM